MKASLLLRLLAHFAGDCVFGSAFGMRCWLVVESSTSSDENQHRWLLLLLSDPRPLYKAAKGQIVSYFTLSVRAR